MEDLRVSPRFSSCSSKAREEREKRGKREEKEREKRGKREEKERKKREEKERV